METTSTMCPSSTTCNYGTLTRSLNSLPRNGLLERMAKAYLLWSLNSIQEDFCALSGTMSLRVAEFQVSHFISNDKELTLSMMQKLKTKYTLIQQVNLRLMTALWSHKALIPRPSNSRCLSLSKRMLLGSSTRWHEQRESNAHSRSLC